MCSSLGNVSHTYLLCQCDLSRSNLFIVAIILLLFHSLSRSLSLRVLFMTHCIRNGIFQFRVSLLTDGMWHLFNSSPFDQSFYYICVANRELQKKNSANMRSGMNSADSYFSHLQPIQFSCVSFLVLRHIRIGFVVVAAGMQFHERFIQCETLVKICSILFYCVFFSVYVCGYIFSPVCFERLGLHGADFHRTNVALDSRT